MTKVATTVQVGQFTTAQFGNSNDAGYSARNNENVPVKVLAITEGIAGKLYLVLTGNKVGTATNPTGAYGERIKGELYCTCALTFGEGGDVAYLEKAITRLGFTEYQL